MWEIPPIICPVLPENTPYPMITGAQNALASLHDGQWIMLDADQGVVVEAPESIRAAAALAHSERLQQAAQNQGEKAGQRPVKQSSISPQRQKLRELVVPLNLTDAYGPTFSLHGVQVNPRHRQVYPRDGRVDHVQCR